MVNWGELIGEGLEVLDQFGKGHNPHRDGGDDGEDGIMGDITNLFQGFARRDVGKMWGAMQGPKRRASARSSRRGGGRFVSVGERGKVGLEYDDGSIRVMRTPVVAHIGKNLPNHRQITRLRRNLMRHRADVRTLAGVMGYTLIPKGGARRRTYTGRRWSQSKHRR